MGVDYEPLYSTKRRELTVGWRSLVNRERTYELGALILDE